MGKTLITGNTGRKKGGKTLITGNTGRKKGGKTLITGNTERKQVGKTLITGNYSGMENPEHTTGLQRALSAAYQASHTS